MADKPKLQLPDYMEEAFKRNDGVIIQNVGKFTKREDVPEQYWQEVPAEAPKSATSGKEG